MITVSVIGTSGRNTMDKLNAELYEKMITMTKDIIDNTFKLDPKNIILISGGAAWCDHIAVSLFLENYTNNSRLYIPCEWDFINKMYKRSYTEHDCARTANYYHINFSKIIKRNSLHEIDKAVKNGLILDTSFPGFKNRNTAVSQSNYIIAFTFSKGNSPETGGTRDTWNKSKTKNKIHICIDDL